MEGIEINGKIDLGVRRLIVAHVENAITFYGYMVSFTRLKLFSIIAIWIDNPYFAVLLSYFILQYKNSIELYYHFQHYLKVTTYLSVCVHFKILLTTGPIKWGSFV